MPLVYGQVVPYREYERALDMTRATSTTTAPAVPASEAGDNDVKEGGDSSNDGLENAGDAVHDGHEARSDCVADAFDLIAVLASWFLLRFGALGYCDNLRRIRRLPW